MICYKIKNCEKSLNDSKKTLKDRKGEKSKYLIDNTSRRVRYSIIDFENSVYENRQNDTKYDYGIKTDTSIFYVELKGSDVVKGFKQLLTTINETEKCFSGLNKKARLIITKFSKPKRAKQTKEYKDLIKKTGSVTGFVIRQNEYTEII